MSIKHQIAYAEPNYDAHPEWEEVVFGLHWDPVNARVTGQPPADLDAFCVLFDLNGQMMEIVHPGRSRNMNGSVIHTGDSRTGASEWDDERIFVFLNALPGSVSRLAFLVVSVTGQPFDRVLGARCHLSDRISEIPRVSVELNRLSGRTAHIAAILHRDEVGWKVATDIPVNERELFADLRMLVRLAKSTNVTDLHLQRPF